MTAAQKETAFRVVSKTTLAPRTKRFEFVRSPTAIEQSVCSTFWTLRNRVANNAEGLGPAWRAGQAIERVLGARRLSHRGLHEVVEKVLAAMMGVPTSYSGGATSRLSPYLGASYPLLTRARHLATKCLNELVRRLICGRGWLESLRRSSTRSRQSRVWLCSRRAKLDGRLRTSSRQIRSFARSSWPHRASIPHERERWLVRHPR